MGDIRLLGRYQGFSEDHSFGVRFGVKLPTGGPKQTFNVGAEVGMPVDAGLQGEPRSSFPLGLHWSL